MNAFLTQPGISTVRPFRSSICARRCRKRNTFVRSAGRVVMCSVSDSNERVSIGDMQESNLDDPNLIVNADDSDSEFDDDLDLVDIQTQKTAKKRTRKQVEQLEAEINVPIDNTYTSDADTIPSIQDDEFTKYIRTAVMAADQRKGGDILALRISKLTYISSFLVIATGKSPPQLRAIANLVEDQLGKQHGLSPRRIDGVPNSGWVLIDCKYTSIRRFTIKFEHTIFTRGLLTHNDQCYSFTSLQMAIL